MLSKWRFLNQEFITSKEEEEEGDESSLLPALWSPGRVTTQASGGPHMQLDAFCLRERRQQLWWPTSYPNRRGTQKVWWGLAGVLPPSECPCVSKNQSAFELYFNMLLKWNRSFKVLYINRRLPFVKIKRLGLESTAPQKQILKVVPSLIPSLHV